MASFVYILSLAVMFRNSFNTNSVPMEWRRADLVPIFFLLKVVERVALNCRLILLTNMVFEMLGRKVLRKQTEKFIANRNYLRERHHRF